MFLVSELQQIWFVANVIDPQGGIVDNVWFYLLIFVLFLLSVCKQQPIPVSLGETLFCAQINKRV